jgi:hypothetical protein
MVPFLGRELAGARISDLLEEAESASRARAVEAPGDRSRRAGMRPAVGRRLVGLGRWLIGAPVEVR